MRDCFTGNFAKDRWTISDKPHSTYDSFNIVDICDAFVHWYKIREIAKAKRAALEQECVEAKTAGGNVKVTFGR